MTGSIGGIGQLSRRSLPPVTSILLFLATIGMARAQDLCTNIDYLIDQSRSQFADIADKPSGEAGDHDVTRALAGASYCRVTKTSRGSVYHCAWEFPHRAEPAYDAFDELVRSVNECIGQHATLHSDQSVNHPDYYASRRFEVEQADVTVSVKDKGALGRTFVFVRVQGGKSN